jgi:flagellar motor switch/type III secretory pathway protein FliN
MSWLDDLPLEIEVAVAGPSMRVTRILELRAGSVVTTALNEGETVDVFAGGARIGDGELSTHAGRTEIRMVHFGSKP